ncbi:hypothetical protein BS47DRAFT_1374298 [Hydnum rufescens UP504]|uniref:CxC2-like cysteine cluster KDZ transposase-associated domain-containing protein n=1 Tax=Hydnum rufescens UP504 TaxID=1448309 RepID=A0A9P6AH16_9AGAM|nr:hypothetical protein BS47DRAFT_1374298 [Hydnum rufescens UP504]
MCNSFLDSMLWGDGWGYALETLGCPDCEAPGQSGTIRCEECFGGALLCPSCLIRQHQNLPFHQIKVWNGQSFDNTTLKDLSLIIQLSHPNALCPNPKAGPMSFVIFHMNGLHVLNQLLCSCWFPATVLQPQTCMTFQLLHHFHSQTLQVSTSPDGVSGTQSGELAILCPACPHPTVNLPNDWKNVPASSQYLYKVFLAIDANFHQKNALSPLPDPGLGTAFVLSHAAQKDMSPHTILMCSGLSALDHANMKDSKGLQATGVGAVVCACHGFLHPLSIRDLQKGECYCNMDYLVFSSICKNELHQLLFSYNIMCQWWKNLWSHRHDKLPSNLQFNHENVHMDHVIPKFHLHAHMKDFRHTDREVIERNWSAVNPAANSMKKMSEGSCHDTLDDIWEDLNYRKVITMGKYLSLFLPIAFLYPNDIYSRRFTKEVVSCD